jgi:hypothetical protein
MHKINRIQSIPRGLSNPAHRKVENVYSDTRACMCVGPQNGEPVCPCRMRNVVVINGRYKEITDLGQADMGESSGL